jgi:hypothetical protein
LRIAGWTAFHAFKNAIAIFRLCFDLKFEADSSIQQQAGILNLIEAGLMLANAAMN